MVGKRLGVPSDPGSTPTLAIIFCGIQVKGEYGWCRFVLDERRGFTDYFSCLRTGEGRLSAHRGEPRGWRRKSSRHWLQRSVSWWLTCSFLAVQKKRSQTQSTPKSKTGLTFL
ncbi:hypothetical protein Hanom_Chr06g00561621 [Helianthus anomalus]